MKTKDIYLQIRDYIDSQNILDSLENFLGEDDLMEFCDYLKEEYDLDLSENNEYFEEF